MMNSSEVLQTLRAAFPGVIVKGHQTHDELSLSATDNIARAGGCNHPIRLQGSVEVSADGKSIDSWSTDKLPGRQLYVACKTRRASRCPSCARIYRGDAYQLVIAGLRGGKNTPETVKDHPALFVTLTAPSFGEVHAHRKDPRDRTKIAPCRPRRNGETCKHGISLGCWQRHDKDDSEVGQPFCFECFDYERAVIWNNAAPRLWRVTRTNIDRRIAAKLKIPVKKAKEHFRTQFVKVAEFQARGLIHFHVTIRLDGKDIEDNAPLTADELAQAVREAVAASSVQTVMGEKATWGTAGFDIRVIGANNQSRKNAAFYSAKYSVKGADAKGVLDRRFGQLSEDHILKLPINDHLKRLVWMSWQLGELGREIDESQPPRQSRIGGTIRIIKDQDCGKWILTVTGGLAFNARHRIRRTFNSREQALGFLKKLEQEPNPYRSFGMWAHQFGVGGHFLTKSRASESKDGYKSHGWSTTFQALRSARSEIHDKSRRESWQKVKPGSLIDINSDWTFTGVGYRTKAERDFAERIRKDKTEAVKPAA